MNDTIIEDRQASTVTHAHPPARSDTAHISGGDSHANLDVILPPLSSPQPQETAPGVYCLETGSAFLRSNMYFVQSGSSWALIDNGWSHCGRLIRETAESLFGANTRSAAILLTHVHPDHSGSAPELSRMWDLPVSLHPDDMPLAEGTLAALEGYPVGPLDRWLILPVMRALPRQWLEAKLVENSLKDREGIDRGVGAAGATYPRNRSRHADERPHDRRRVTGLRRSSWHWQSGLSNTSLRPPQERR